MKVNTRSDRCVKNVAIFVILLFTIERVGFIDLKENKTKKTSQTLDGNQTTWHVVVSNEHGSGQLEIHANNWKINCEFNHDTKQSYATNQASYRIVWMSKRDVTGTWGQYSVGPLCFTALIVLVTLTATFPP